MAGRAAWFFGRAGRPFREVAVRPRPFVAMAGKCRMLGKLYERIPVQLNQFGIRLMGHTGAGGRI